VLKKGNFVPPNLASYVQYAAAGVLIKIPLCCKCPEWSKVDLGTSPQFDFCVLF
jgi:hypothetical protein